MKRYLRLCLIACGLLLLAACKRQYNAVEIMETSSLEEYSLITEVAQANPLGLLGNGSSKRIYLLHNSQGNAQPEAIPFDIDEVTWSPDGQWIAYVKYVDNTSSLYLASPDRQQEILVHSSIDHRWFAFSPDGTRIAFVESQMAPRKVSIYVVDISCALEAAKDATCVFEPIFLDEGNSLDWSPNGQSIVYHDHRSEKKQGIYIADATGVSEPQLLVEDGHSPEWSPDGEKIIYHNTDEDKKQGIYTIDAKDASEPVLLVEGGYTPHWSPDGETILFMSYYSRHPTLLAEGIYTIQADGTQLTQLTEEARGGCRAQWSPDGEFITFVSWRNSKCLYGCRIDREFNTSTLYQMTADGENLTRLTLADDEYILWYAWIP